VAEQMVFCPNCTAGKQKRDCSQCNGAGIMECFFCSGRGLVEAGFAGTQTCPECRGRRRDTCNNCWGARYFESICSTCQGKGLLENSVADDVIRQRQEEEQRAAEQYRIRQKQEEDARRIREQVQAREQAEQERRRVAEEPLRQAQEARQKQETARYLRQGEGGEMWKKIGWTCLTVWIFVQVAIPIFFSLNHRSPSPSASPANRVTHVDVSELTTSDLAGKSAWELTVMRNEPYARHGFKFGKGKANARLYAHFSKFAWYRPTTASMDAVTAKLSPAQRHNTRLILDYQNAHGRR
jgi:hypothetical protein